MGRNLPRKGLEALERWSFPRNPSTTGAPSTSSPGSGFLLSHIEIQHLFIDINRNPGFLTSLRFPKSHFSSPSTSQKSDSEPMESWNGLDQKGPLSSSHSMGRDSSLYPRLLQAPSNLGQIPGWGRPQLRTDFPPFHVPKVQPIPILFRNGPWKQQWIRAGQELGMEPEEGILGIQQLHPPLECPRHP